MHPQNPYETICSRLVFNVDDKPTKRKFFVCDTCDKYATYPELLCTCGKIPNKMPLDLDSEGHEDTITGNGVFVREDTMFLSFT